MVIGDITTKRQMVNKMTQDLKFEKTVLIATTLMAGVLFIAQGLF